MPRAIHLAAGVTAVCALIATPAAADTTPDTGQPSPPDYSVTTWEEYFGYTPNTYTITQPIPEYLTTTTTITVDAIGQTPVCFMRLGDTTRRAAPYTFTLAPQTLEPVKPRISVYTCDRGYEEQVADIVLNTTVPFQVSPEIIENPTSAHQRIDVTSHINSPATITIQKGSDVISQLSIDALSATSTSIPTKNLKQTTRFTANISAANGISMTLPIIATQGWALLDDADDPRLIYTPCQTITWYYNPENQPRKATSGSLRKDIHGSLKRISRHASLTFTEVNDPESATLIFSWQNMGKKGPAATGGYSNWTGSVTFNSAHDWPTNKYAGFKPFTPYKKGSYLYTSGPAGRGWLVIHETMHALGLGHVDNPKAIMHPINSGQGKFTRGDIEGLQTLYPNNCPTP